MTVTKDEIRAAQDEPEARRLRRELFDEVGGFDESMAVNFNDVDFSLRIRATGRRVIWTPFASWQHFERQTRPPTATPEEFDAVGCDAGGGEFFADAGENLGVLEVGAFDQEA